MSDTSGPMIVGPDGKTPRSLRNVKQRTEDKSGLSEARVAELIQGGVIAGLVQITKHLAVENQKVFDMMEDVVTERVMAELRRRSIRGRLHTRWLVARETCRGYLVELGLADPMARPAHINLEPKEPIDAEAEKADGAADPVQLQPEG